MSAVSTSGALLDGTAWSVTLRCSCGHEPCRGGQHVGTGVVAVTLERDGARLVLASGLRSVHMTQKAMRSCSIWPDVPFTIESPRWLT